ncbi:hypothetical protein CFELI_13620 [Corynebacterium felinum]|uniref:Uncharacterized protein n=1 Tax=Corynebacterium felinum TaxID=131318 RepID=A0ABU2B698_9CORY|nr:hypothetical protein [Corynebacterium felinum]WJY96302.1 hypothetical protein CFELI_13620 [Corynebacterium felinum]
MKPPFIICHFFDGSFIGGECGQRKQCIEGGGDQSRVLLKATGKYFFVQFFKI